MNNKQTAGGRYGRAARGLLEVHVCGWRFVRVDTRLRRPEYRDRTDGLTVGPYVFNVSRVAFNWGGVA